MIDDVTALIDEIGRCRHCAAHLPLGPRPVVQIGAAARILVIGQAPGTKVHTSGIPWSDDSGDRLRAWMGIEQSDFYDPATVVPMPMGFCYPGKDKSGDAPPRPECAPLWHDCVLTLLPADRLTLLVGSYAQQRYLPKDAGATLVERVRGFRRHAPSVFPLPHPSWRSIGWQRRYPWFEAEVLPELRAAVRARLGGR